MSCSVKLSRMFLLGFDGCTLEHNERLADALARHSPAGVILFDRNVDTTIQNFSSPQQLQELTGQLQEAASEPLLIAVDQEGGRVCRLKERDGFPATVSAAELGRELPELSTGPAAAMAAALAQYGINLNLAPVADLNLNPANPIIAQYGRSFDCRADAVAAHCRAFIKAHHQQGIACCLKHFPGHGSAAGDSHLGFVDITDDWQEEELAPYTRLIRDGLADAVMTAHVVHNRLDPAGLPATLSPAVLTTLLRRKMGFDGVIMTDDLQMKAISDRYGFWQAVQLAVTAGADLLIVGNNLVRNPDALDQGVAAIQELLDQGLVSEERLEQSLQRIQRLLQVNRLFVDGR
ncbi:MAG: beta-N-acetylhexosaminidase [Candidatus Electrothrix sp. YB6]